MSERFPFGPLERLAKVKVMMEATEDTWFEWSFPTASDVTSRQLAGVFGVDRATIRRWRRDGLLWSKADRAAAAVGETPWSIWPDRWGRDVAA